MNLSELQKKMEMPVTLTLLNRDSSITITTNNSPITIDEYLEELVVPVLKAAGFHEDTINDYIERT